MFFVDYLYKTAPLTHNRATGSYGPGSRIDNAGLSYMITRPLTETSKMVLINWNVEGELTVTA